MINAFRHQRFNTVPLHLDFRNCPTCSTPFGIRDSTLPHGVLVEIDSDVLNAFRHQRFNTSIRPCVFGLYIVLNAFRHQRFNTLRVILYVLKPLRAQRLSASEIQHSKQSQYGFRASHVLNAFRHQRFNTVGLYSAIAKGICAQRLSASEIQHRDRRDIKNIAQGVLNAFRHQRFNTPILVNHFQGWIFVLNAFRHQRFNTLMNLRGLRHALSAQRLSASEIQHELARLSPFASQYVLNAFRHQRFNTRAAWITFWMILIGAQRLSASEIQHKNISVKVIAHD